MPTLAELRRGTLAGATTLALRADLRAFPREILDLADTLEVLDLSGNALDALPDDLGRLRRLRVLFCSGNRFARLPPSLGDCPSLTQIGFRGTGLREVPSESLPPSLRWLTLTDNALASLPDAIGERPQLRKLMLAGNRLRALPDRLGGAERLELIRLSANDLDAVPRVLDALPRLAWLACGGNPFEAKPSRSWSAVPRAPWSRLAIGARLGGGASGDVHRVRWDRGGGDAPAVDAALKLFKGAVTSDGRPEHELAMTLTAGTHPHLLGALGTVADHPEGRHGLLLPLLPPDWRALAGPPSAAGCTRDDWRGVPPVGAPVALAILRAAASALAHLHGRGLLHGDLYAHNILHDGCGGAVLTDLGAAWCTTDTRHRLLDLRAWSILVDELVSHAAGTLPPTLDALARAAFDGAVDAAALPGLVEKL